MIRGRRNRETNPGRIQILKRGPVHDPFERRRTPWPSILMEGLGFITVHSFPPEYSRAHSEERKKEGLSDVTVSNDGLRPHAVAQVA
jgi:hypothetical protein